MDHLEALIDDLRNYQYSRYLLGGALALSTAITIRKIINSIFYSSPTADINIEKCPRDKVTLCQPNRGPYAPSISPFPIKLETYLRMTNIPYQNVLGAGMSPKKKTPWMVYQGQAVGDTQLCIELLNRERGVDLDVVLSEKDRAIARAFRALIEEHLYWAGLVHRYKYMRRDSDGWAFLKKCFRGTSDVYLYAICRHMTNLAHAQGMARHTLEEIEEMVIADIRALSTFLDNKEFFMGSEPTEVDCCVFGFMATAYYHAPGSPVEAMVKPNGECSNLGDYCMRMKERYWPDWDECTTRGATQEATK